MLAQRVLVVVVLLPVGLAAIWFGGQAFVALVALILGLAAWEFAQLFRVGGLQPYSALVVAGVLVLVYDRYSTGFATSPLAISLLVLVSMAYHLIAYERGREQAGTDFAITLAGILYIGWLGAYLISLRDLPEGKWWVLLVLPVVWIADSGAYFIGRRFGRHRLSPRLSPKKTWEGYLGGIVTGILGAVLLTAAWDVLQGPGVLMPLWQGAVLGAILSILTTLGDLGESMIKRQVGVKDSGNLLPGHGGAFDRIDSWLWAGVLGYYTILWLQG